VSFIGTAGMYAFAPGREERMRVEMEGTRKRWEMVTPGMMSRFVCDKALT
jgi:hypothetical protein